MVLSKMKETAEAYLGTKVTHAVVTVPACKDFIFSKHSARNLLFLGQISMTLNAKLPKMLVLSLDSLSSV